jgi:hypothetical protein
MIYTWNIHPEIKADNNFDDESGYGLNLIARVHRDVQASDEDSKGRDLYVFYATVLSYNDVICDIRWMNSSKQHPHLSYEKPSPDVAIRYDLRRNYVRLPSPQRLSYSTEFY